MAHTVRQRAGPGEVLQELHGAQTECPVSLPLILDSQYVCTGPGDLTLRDAVITKVRTTPKEQEKVLKALALMLQASRDLQFGPMPEPLDKDNDIAWDWQCITLTATEYAAFAYATVKYDALRRALDCISYDWTPEADGTGTLTVRKKCCFQSRLTRAIASEIEDAL